MKIKTEAKLFLSNENETSIEIDDIKYYKVQYDEELTLIYRERSGYKISNLQMQIVGVYSKTKQDFVIICDRYLIEPLLLNVDDMSLYYEENLVTAISNAIHTEIDNICVNIAHNAKSVEYWEKIKEKAKYHYLNFSKPKFELNIDFTLNLDNLSEYSKDEDEFIFSEAETFFNHNLSLKDKYMEYCDIKKELERISQNPDTLLLVQKTLKSDVVFNSYKKVSLILVDKDGNEERIQGLEVKNVFLYPVYSIKEIYWGRKKVFDITNFDDSEIQSLKTSLSYNKEYLNTLYQQKSYDVDEQEIMKKYISDSMFDVKEFREFILKKSSVNLRIFPEKYLEDKDYIRNLPNLCLYNYFPYVNENWLLTNEDFVYELVSNTKRLCNEYHYIPKHFQKDPKYLMILAKDDFERIIEYVDETNIQNKDLRTLIANHYNTKPVCPISTRWSSDKQLFIIDEEQPVLMMTTTGNFRYLPEKYRKDKTFVLKFLNRMVDYMKNSQTPHSDLRRQVDFNSIYAYLEGTLKKDMDVLLLLIKNSIITTYLYDSLHPSVKTDEFCYIALQGNIEVLQYASDKVKDKIIENNVELISNLRLAKFGGTNNSLSTKYLLKIAELSLNSYKHLAFFSRLNYIELKDIKTLLACLKINNKIYKELSSEVTRNQTLAEYICQFYSVIPYLGQKHHYNTDSVFDNKKIMTKSIEHDSKHFKYIPTASRKTGPAPLLEDFDFIKKAVSLDSFNITYLDIHSKFRSNKEIAIICLLDNMNLLCEFNGKLLRDEDFVFDFVRQYLKLGLDIEKLKVCYLSNLVNKKTLNSKEFKKEFPTLC